MFNDLEPDLVTIVALNVGKTVLEVTENQPTFINMPEMCVTSDFRGMAQKQSATCDAEVGGQPSCWFLFVAFSHKPKGIVQTENSPIYSTV